MNDIIGWELRDKMLCLGCAGEDPEGMGGTAIYDGGMDEEPFCEQCDELLLPYCDEDYDDELELEEIAPAGEFWNEPPGGFRGGE